MITICKRQYDTDEFKWFYHPMLPQNEKEYFHFFVWVGKRWIIAWPKKHKKEQPEIVRCKYCKHWDEEYDGYCAINHIFTTPDWYCADGERKCDDD